MKSGQGLELRTLVSSGHALLVVLFVVPFLKEQNNMLTGLSKLLGPFMAKLCGTVSCNATYKICLQMTNSVSDLGGLYLQIQIHNYVFIHV